MLLKLSKGIAQSSLIHSILAYEENYLASNSNSTLLQEICLPRFMILASAMYLPWKESVHLWITCITDFQYIYVIILQTLTAHFELIEYSLYLRTLSNYGGIIKMIDVVIQEIDRCNLRDCFTASMRNLNSRWFACCQGHNGDAVVLEKEFLSVTWIHNALQISQNPLHWSYPFHFNTSMDK